MDLLLAMVDQLTSPAELANQLLVDRFGYSVAKAMQQVLGMCLW